MKKILLFSAIVALFTVGCQKEIIDNSHVGDDAVVAFDAYIDNEETDTRVAVTHDPVGKKISFAWEKNDTGHTDSFTLYKNVDGEYVFVGNYVYSGSGNRFAAADGLILRDGDYIAVMPAVIRSECPTLTDWENKALNITTQTQDGALGHLNTSVRLKSNVFNYNSSSGIVPQVTFKHELAIVQFNFTLSNHIKPSRVVLSDGDTKEQSYLLTFSGVSQEDNTYSAFFMIYPSGDGSTSRDLKFTITTSEAKERVIIVAAPNKYEPGKYYVANVGAAERTDGYIQITTADEFRRIGRHGESEYTRDKKYILMNDIDLEGGVGNQWVSINDFTGTFDGNGKKIIGLYTDSENDDNIGIFGSVWGSAVIKNVVISNPTIIGNTYVAALACRVSGSSVIQNCSVIGGTITGKEHVGGVVGALNNSTIEGCSNYATVNGVSRAGGVVGSGTNSNVIGCHNDGSVTATTDKAGGVLGSYFFNDSPSELTIIGCYNKGAITAPTSLGGVVGILNANNKIIGCYNTGELVGTTNVGGIIGFAPVAETDAPILKGNYYSIPDKGKGVGNYSEYEVAGSYTNVALFYSLNNEDRLNAMNYAIVEYGGNLSKGLSYVGGVDQNNTHPYLTSSYGTNSVIPVYTEADLRYLILGNPNVHYILMNNIVVYGMHGSIYWRPIGTPENPFMGTFNGNGKKISDISGLNTDNFALFGATQSAKITNLTIENANIIATSKENNAVLVAVANDTYIADCTIKNSVITIRTKLSNAGGFIGKAYNSTIVNCIATGGELTTENTDNSVISENIGGIVGAAYNTTITKCNNESFKISNATADNVGGVVGYAEASIIKGCANLLGNSITGRNNLGGVAGYVGSVDNTDSHIIGCYSQANMFAYGSSCAPIAGRVSGSSSVVGCYSVSYVQLSNANTNATNIGLLIGQVDAEAILKNCYFYEFSEVGVGSSSEREVIGKYEELAGDEFISKIGILNNAIYDAGFTGIVYHDGGGYYPKIQ